MIAVALNGPIDAISRIAVRPQSADASINHVVQNKHGIVHTVRDEKLGDVVYGGNAYDGRISVDTAVDSNGLERVYILAAAHPTPRRVLVIGMSTGAWTRVVSGFPGVEQIDVVEINPGYLDLVKSYPEVSPLLADPRIRIHIDDGRRWLKRHPDARYDLIVQNTTFHWRANSTNLLSIEYFREVSAHMLPGAIFAANTTSSLDVYRTAEEAFAFAFRFRNFVYAGDRDFRVAPATVLARLHLCRIGDAPAFREELFERGGLVDKIARSNFEPVSAVLAQPEPVPPAVVSDRNLMVEYRHGMPSTFALLQRLLPPNPNAVEP
jgi:spermidine synthase